ncbi:MAG: hypothetical protein EKK61_06335 [Rickettsiales bacterium]|nr:MAG: hypothetical protein EKK61_06335 [Rickettsiales bacterium]
MNIDIAIVVFFSLLTLTVGILTGKKVANIREFALGGRNFSTTTLVATIVATWATGGDFDILVNESYEHGLYFIISGLLGMLTVLSIIGIVFVPRMGEFLGDLSIAESMGKMYGDKVKLITVFAGCIGTIGVIAAQFIVAGKLLEYSLEVPKFYGIMSGALIVTIYSSLGGIRSVTFTDVIQFFTFGVVMPTLAFFIYGTFGNADQILSVISSNDNFKLSKVFDLSSEKSLYFIFLFLFMAIPSFDPAIFQRISMAKNVFQARKAFVIAAFVYTFLGLTIAWIGVLALVAYPNSVPTEMAQRVLMDYSFTGLKGLTIAGILAMMMSSADSFINSTSILFTNDFCKAAGIKLKDELKTSRIISFVLGFFAFLIALYSSSLLNLMIKTKSFYMPVVSVPFMFAIFGFRSSTKSVLIGMAGGVITTAFFEIFMGDRIISAIPGMFANMVFLFGSHYILKQEGGWVGIKDYGPLNIIRAQRKKNFNNIISAVKNFNIKQFCIVNSPKEESAYLYLGIFALFSTYFSSYTLPQTATENYHLLISFIYPLVLFTATTLISSPLWVGYVKRFYIISYIWVFALFYILVCVGFIQILISDFSKFQLMTFMLNFVVLSILVRWQAAVLIMVVGCFVSFQFFELYTGKDVLAENIGNIQFTVAYLLMLMSSVLIAFFKPKQEYVEATEIAVGTLNNEVTFLNSEVGTREVKINSLSNEVIDLNDKIDFFHNRISDQAKEIERLGQTSQRILNNLNHELRLPVGNVMNFSDMLIESLHKKGDKYVNELAKEVHNNSTRLSSMILNMLDLAMLDVKKIQLDRKTMNLGELVKERVERCRKVYLGEKSIDFKLDIQPEILISIDPNYIRQTVDNLIINAINFSEKGLIEVNVFSNGTAAIFTVKDQGVGIPATELYDIFTPFKMGSNTQSKAEGRGVGLALCKSAVEAHRGTITAQSKGTGALFTVTLPFK